MNKKMKALDKASKVNFKFENMDSETQEAIKSLINHLMVKREEKKLGGHPSAIKDRICIYR